MVRSHNFEHAGTTKTLQWLGGGIGFAFSSSEESVTDVDPDGAGERA
jgi:hypothetical protein